MEVDEERFIPPRLKISSQEQDTNIQHFLSALLSIWNLFGEEILKIDNFKRNNHSWSDKLAIGCSLLLIKIHVFEAFIFFKARTKTSILQIFVLISLKCSPLPAEQPTGLADRAQNLRQVIFMKTSFGTRVSRIGLAVFWTSFYEIFMKYFYLASSHSPFFSNLGNQNYTNVKTQIKKTREVRSTTLV